MNEKYQKESQEPSYLEKSTPDSQVQGNVL